MNHRRLLALAFAASVLLHVLAVLLTRDLSLLRPGPGSARAEEAVELVLVAPDAEDERAATPTAYTEIPERLASETPPERADYLALFDARAADRQPGGEEDGAPAADVAASFPQVALDPEDLASAPGIRREPTGPAAPAARASRPEERRRLEGGDLPWTEARDAGGDWLEGTPAPSILAPGESGRPGDRGFEFPQPAQGDLTGGTSVEGDFSLNTYEWNYAPWMHRFVQDLYRNWMAPYAYRLGVIHGVTRIRLVVEKDGRPSAMEVVGTEGHASLHAASTAALRAFAPYAPLPADFPEEHLVILLSLHYPQWKR